MWRTAGLADVCELIARGTAPKYTETGGILVLNQKCVRDHSIQFTQARRHNEQVKPTRQERLIREWDVLVNSTGQGTLGRVAQLREHLQQDVTVDSHVTILRPIQDLFYPPFFGYLMIALEPIFQKSGLGAGGQTELSAKRLKTEFSVTFPESKDEQQRIVAKLDAAFAEIDRALKSYEDSLSNARDCLGKARAALIEEILSSSNTAKLSEIASLKNGLNYNKSEKGNAIKILGVGDFQNEFSTGTEGLQLIETSEPVSNDYHLEHGDIVFVRSNGNKQLIGRSILVEAPSEPATFSGFCIRCRTERAGISPVFLCHFLKSSIVRDKLTSGGGGANISNLNQKILSDIDVPLLTEQEQLSLVESIEELERGFEDFIAILANRILLTSKLKSAILAQELQPPQSEAA